MTGAADGPPTCSRPPAPGWRPAGTTSARSAASWTRSATPARSAPTPTRSSARKQAGEQRQQSDAEAAAARLAEARQAAAESLAAWTARWAAAADTTSPAAPPSLAAVTANLPRGVIAGDDAATLAAALDRIGEPGAASLSEIVRRLRRRPAGRHHRRPGPAWTPPSPRPAGAWRTCGKSATPSPPSRTTRPRRPTCARPAATRAPAPRSGSSSGSPPTSPTRSPPRSRVPCTARACSPPGCTQTGADHHRAAGRRSRRLPHPHRLRQRPGASPGAASGGAKTLADVLVAEDQEHVPSDVIVAVLRSITLADDIMAAGSDIPAHAEPRDGSELRERRARRGLDYVFGDVPALGPYREPRSVRRARRPRHLGQGPVQLRRPRRRPAQGGTRVHRRDQPRRPPPRPPGRTGRGHRAGADASTRDRDGPRPGTSAARRLPPRPPRAPRHRDHREGRGAGRQKRGAARARPRRGRQRRAAGRRAPSPRPTR